MFENPHGYRWAYVIPDMKKGRPVGICAKSAWLMGDSYVRIVDVFTYERRYFMAYVYKTQGTCSSKIELELDGNIVHNVKFTGGCHGNLQAIPALVEGLTVEEVERRIGGIKCGFKNTSCGDQLAKAVRAAYEEANA